MRERWNDVPCRSAEQAVDAADSIAAAVVVVLQWHRGLAIGIDQVDDGITTEQRGRLWERMRYAKVFENNSRDRKL